MICIWCKEDFPKLSLEHGIPEGLACPRELEMRDVACTKCNSDLSRVDRALVKQFESITVMYGVKRKKGRAPTINSWQSIRSEHRSDGPHIFINGGPGIVESGGKPLRPPSKANGISNVWVKPETNQLGYSQQFGNDSRFLPALYKIGLNLVAKQFGPAEAASAKYDHVRSFVRGESDAQPLTAALDRTTISGPVTETALITKTGQTYPAFRVTLLGVSFLIDLAPDQKSLHDIQGASALYGEHLYLFPISKAA
jgi:hypothetical protein